jgi:hypothetical protein
LGRALQRHDASPERWAPWPRAYARRDGGVRVYAASDQARRDVENDLASRQAQIDALVDVAVRDAPLPGPTLSTVVSRLRTRRRSGIVT